MHKILFIIPEFLQQPTGGLEKQSRIIIENLKKFYDIVVLCFGCKNRLESVAKIVSYETSRGIDYENHLSKINALLLVNKIKSILPDLIVVMDNTQYLFFILNMLYMYDDTIPVLLSISTHPELFKQRINVDNYQYICDNLLNIRTQLDAYVCYYKDANVIGNYTSTINVDRCIKDRTSVFACSNLDDDNKGFHLIYEYYKKLPTDKLIAFGNTRIYTNTNNVMIYPITDSISSIYKFAHVFISNSRYEGISNSALEAHSLNIPIICNAFCEGVRFLIKDRDLTFNDFFSFKMALYKAYTVCVVNDKIDNAYISLLWKNCIDHLMDIHHKNNYNHFKFRKHIQELIFHEN